jgi:hypothetical protein
MMRVHAEAARAGRLDQLYLFHLGYPEISARYNGIGSFSRITEVASRATNALPSSGNSAAFKEFSWRFTNLVAQAQVALGRVPTYELILRDITNIEPLLSTYRRGQPMIGFSTSMVAAGTLAAAYTGVDDTIAHLGEVVDSLQSGRMPEPQYPKYWRVAINESVARSLNVVISDAARGMGNRPRGGSR